MKFSLAFFLKRRGIAILLLLLSIVISLLLSDIPWLVKFINGNNVREGMVSDNSISTINNILNDKYATNTQKLSAIKGIVDIMETSKDQSPYSIILNDGTKNEKEKIDEITKLVDKYMNSSSKQTKDATKSIKKDQDETANSLNK